VSEDLTTVYRFDLLTWTVRPVQVFFSKINHTPIVPGGEGENSRGPEALSTGEWAHSVEMAVVLANQKKDEIVMSLRRQAASLARRDVRVEDAT